MGMPMSAWFAAGGLTVGIQYPWRVTPFVDGRFAAGILGGDVAGVNAITYTYMGGVDVGVELYVLGRFYLSAAVGWVRPSYRGFDLAAAKAHPSAPLVFETFTSDSLTFKVGIGI
jgi:hypothetical protein